MYYAYGVSGPSLLIESTDSMIWQKIFPLNIFCNTKVARLGETYPAKFPVTVFIRIVAAATINFSLAGVWLLYNRGRLLFEDGFYLFWRDIYLCADLVVSSCDRLVFQDYFSNSRDIMIEKQQLNQARDIFCHAFASN